METGIYKIIIVDDDNTNLAIAKNLLNDRYEIITVKSGEKLFEILENVTPDLILLDIKMPVMNGFEVIIDLKNSERTADIPVIFLTAMDDPDSEAMGLYLGAVDYIYKPFTKEHITESIEKHLPMDKKSESKN